MCYLTFCSRWIYVVGIESITMGEIAAGIESDPDRLNGVPVISGTRIPVSFVVESLESMTIEELASDLAITQDQVNDAINYYRKLGNNNFALKSNN